MTDTLSASALVDQASLALGSDPAARLPKGVKTAAEAEAAAQEFEAVFIGQMVGAMFEGVKTDGPFGGGHAESMFRSLLTDEYSKAIVDRGGIGIADSVKAELLRMQEGK